LAVCVAVAGDSGEVAGGQGVVEARQLEWAGVADVDGVYGFGVVGPVRLFGGLQETGVVGAGCPVEVHAFIVRNGTGVVQWVMRGWNMLVLVGVLV
jgi:hypothetical protein